MTKKIFIIFIFVWIIFGISKVQALSEKENINPQRENLEELIQININGRWEDLETEKYIANGMLIYKLGNSSESANSIKVENKQNNAKVKKIIKSGYKQKKPSEFELDNENDLYIATKIAIDCVINNYSLNINYRAKSDLNELLKLRAAKIISTAQKLITISNNEEDTNHEKIRLEKKGEFERDDIVENYYSQKYEVKTKEVELIDYKIIEQSIAGISYYIGDVHTGAETLEFNAQNNTFKIMVPEENREKLFEIILILNVNYNTDEIFMGTGGDNKYIIYAETKESSEETMLFSNAMSNLAINFVDEDTGERIYGSSIKIRGKNYTIDKDDEVIISKLGKENVYVYFLSIPDQYIKPEDEYKISIKYKEKHIENIKLKHKKGKLLINTNLSNSEFKIYNKKTEIYTLYKTNEDGIICIDEINTGEYLLKQVKVQNGYKLIGDVTFNIKYNETEQITLINERKDTTESSVNKAENNVVPPKGGDNNKIDKIPNEENKEETNVNQNNDKNTDKFIEKETKEKSNNIKVSRKELLKLPRTGTDYFYIKLILAYLIIFISLVILILKKDKKSKI